MALALVVGLVPIIAAPAAADVSAAVVTPAPNTAGAAAAYTVAFNVGATGALVAGTSTITVTFPSGTIVPPAIAAASVTVNGTALTVAPTVVGLTVTMTTPVAVAALGAVSVVFASPAAGLQNPLTPAATYTLAVKTSVETTAVASGVYTIAAQAASNLTPALGRMNPPSGTVGTIITVDNGAFVWPVNDQILSITFDGVAMATSPAIVKTGTGLTAGQYLATFNVPIAKKGNHTVKVSDGVNSAEATFVVIGKVTVSPANGPTGTSVSVLGSGYNAGVGVDLYFDGTKVVSTSTDVAGAFTTTFAVPTATKGDHTVKGNDGGGYAGVTATFTVTEKISLSPTSGNPGVLVTISGSQFAALSTISINIAGGSWVSAFTLTGTDTTFSKTANVPALSPGVKLVEAIIGGVTVATTTFTVTTLPLSLSPSTGVVGTQVAISGSGFRALGETVDIVIDTTTWGSTTAVSGGTFNAAMTIPDTIATSGKAYTVTATGATSGVKAEATFTHATRSLTISPTGGTGGITVVVTGVGFKSSSIVAVGWDINPEDSALTGTGELQVIANADASGNFSAALTVPAGLSTGDKSVRAEVLGLTSVNAKKTFTLSAPTISVSPSSGAAGSNVVITGVGFPAYSPIPAGFGVRIGGLDALPTAGSTDAAGGFTVTAMVPLLPAGPTIVMATAASISATSSFTVTAAAATPATALAGIAGKYTRVWHYDAADTADHWKLYDPAVPPSLNDLTVLVKGKGYFIYVTENVTLIYKGFSYPLVGGQWNLVGWQD